MFKLVDIKSEIINYCPRGSNGLLFSSEFFVAVSTITHELLHSA